jgi:hypothetical protein
LNYRYNSSTNELAIGGGLATVVGPEHIVNVRLWTSGQFSTGAGTYPFFAEPFLVRAKVGDVGQGDFELPWFNRADAVLLFWDVHDDVAGVPLQIKVVNESCVQVWPGNSVVVS